MTKKNKPKSRPLTQKERVELEAYKITNERLFEQAKKDKREWSGCYEQLGRDIANMLRTGVVFVR